jgi:hypothetical protein
MVTLRPKESLEMSKITKFCHHYTNSKVEGELGNGTKAMECTRYGGGFDAPFGKKES